MKTSLFTVIATTLLTFATYAQQVTLFDSEGMAIAYIDYEEESTIFLWDGTPVAFLAENGSDVHVIGYNGTFLGWYENGIVYDKTGHWVGTRKDAIDLFTHIEPIKGIQSFIPIKPITPLAPFKPFWTERWSSIALVDLLLSGRK